MAVGAYGPAVHEIICCRLALFTGVVFKGVVEVHEVDSKFKEGFERGTGLCEWKERGNIKNYSKVSFDQTEDGMLSTDCLGYNMPILHSRLPQHSRAIQLGTIDL